jgi:hypothetical protein
MELLLHTRKAFSASADERHAKQLVAACMLLLLTAAVEVLERCCTVAVLQQ